MSILTFRPAPEFSEYRSGLAAPEGTKDLPSRQNIEIASVQAALSKASDANTHATLAGGQLNLTRAYTMSQKSKNQEGGQSDKVGLIFRGFNFYLSFGGPRD